jgi:hypothetical protein
MPEDAPVNTDAGEPGPDGPRRVLKIQAKLHVWVAADPGRRFGGLFRPGSMKIVRYRYRGTMIPSPRTSEPDQTTA